MCPPLTVSIVDDDSVVREATADLVNSLGYNVTMFASGEAFLESGEVERVSCLITDLQMPSVTGLELQRRLLAAGHKTPIIFITAFPKGQARDRALSAGAVAFLTKPFEEATLIESLRAALAARSLNNA